jgi:hypothetical protein
MCGMHDKDKKFIEDFSLKISHFTDWAIMSHLKYIEMGISELNIVPRYVWWVFNPWLNKVM